jgi:S-formylglutathione hydrolase FrmB
VKRSALLSVIVSLVLSASATATATVRRDATRSGAGVALRSGDGLQVKSVKRLDPRLLALSVKTSALPGPANVRVLLPSGYAAHPHRRYPVLYLLHGTSGRAADWTTLGGAEATTAGKPLIVVMPDIGLDGDGGGWCTNWPDGMYRWETFHIDQLVPWVDANLRTIRARGSRAIAGLSQGGFCSMSYAARHPDLFGVALSYSGAPDIAYDSAAQLLVTPVINATETFLDQVPPNSIFGSRLDNEINWAAHDPTTLAGNLRDTRMMLFTGNGQPGPFDHGVNVGADAIEAGVHELTMLFHNRLKTLGIPSFYDDYGKGTHSWPYWARDLKQSIGPLMADFAKPVTVPGAVSYKSADQSYSIYGWTVAMHRAVREFSALSDASRGGFTLYGSGSATVTTPPTLKPGRLYTVSITSMTGTRSLRLRPARRMLTLAVPLGPSNTVQEYPLDGPPTATHVYSTKVTIR